MISKIVLGPPALSRRAVVMLMLTFVVVVGSRTGGAAEPRPIKLALHPFMSSAPLFIALDQGLFEDEGLEVEIVSAPSGANSLPVLVQGRVDVLATWIAPAIFNLAARGAPIKLVAGRSYEGRDGCVFTAIVVRNELLADGRLADRASLRGLRLASDRTGATHFYVDRLLSSGGLTFEDMDLVDVPYVAKLEALARGRLDLTAAGEPWLTRILDDGHASLWIPVSELVPEFQSTFLVFGPNLLRDDREAGRRFLAAYKRVVEHYLDQGKSPRNIEIVAEHTGLDADVVARACWPLVTRSATVDLRSLALYQDWALEEGLIDERVEVETMVDAEILAGAVPQQERSR